LIRVNYSLFLDLDIYVRSEILHKILEKLNETTIYQNGQSDACKLKVKSSMSTCTAVLIIYVNKVRGESYNNKMEKNKYYTLRTIPKVT